MFSISVLFSQRRIRVNLVDLVKSFQTSIYLQNLASIQPRTIVRSTAAAAAENEPSKACRTAACPCMAASSWLVPRTPSPSTSTLSEARRRRCRQRSIGAAARFRSRRRLRRRSRHRRRNGRRNARRNGDSAVCRRRTCSRYGPANPPSMRKSISGRCSSHSRRSAYAVVFRSQVFADS